MVKKNLFFFLGAYASEADARADYEVLKDLHIAGAVGTYDAAVITKDADGKVHVNKDELPSRHGAWTGDRGGRRARHHLPAVDHRERRGRRPHRRRDRTLVAWDVPQRRQGARARAWTPVRPR